MILKITRGHSQDIGRVLDLQSQTQHTLGRGNANSFELNDSNASRSHASISQSDAGYQLQDLKSTQGTYYNHTALIPGQPVLLKPGDTIRIATTEIVAQGAEGASAPLSVASAAVPAPAPVAIQEAPPEFDQAFAMFEALYSPTMMELKKRIQEEILGRLKLTELASQQIQDDEMRVRLEKSLDDVLMDFHHEIPGSLDGELFRQSLVDELLEYGPITPLLRDPTISEVMVNGPSNIFIERNGNLVPVNTRFYDNRHLLSIIQRIVEPLGRRIDESSPMVDARLPDGSRVNAVIKPLVLDGNTLTIRKFSDKKLTDADLVKFGSLTPEMALFLAEAVRAKQNILVSGGTGSGKTTLLNILSQAIPLGERVITIEDSAELKLDHPNLIRMETRPPNIEGEGRVSIRDLVINSLRMRPDRIVVGECRGAEAIDMLQAMNTGHDGSLTTVHANSPRDAMQRLETMTMMAGFDLPSRAIREQVSSAVNIIVQQSRLVDGSRKIIKIEEITGIEGDTILTSPIFRFQQTDLNEDGKVEGFFASEGNRPRFIEELNKVGNLNIDYNIFDLDERLRKFLMQ